MTADQTAAIIDLARENAMAGADGILDRLRASLMPQPSAVLCWDTAEVIRGLMAAVARERDRADKAERRLVAASVVAFGPPKKGEAKADKKMDIRFAAKPKPKKAAKKKAAAG